MGLLLWYLHIRIRAAFGLKVDEDELKDFDLDVVETPEIAIGK